MEKNNHGADSGSCRCKCVRGAVPFLIGVVVALAFGWWVFPDLLFSKQTQPFFFSHTIHAEKAGTSCIDCHSFRADGTFTGLPRLAACVDCHQDVLTPEPGPESTPEEIAAYEAETFFVRNHVRENREVPWLVHQKQPDNVFFSHAAHFNKCYSCHLTMKGNLHLGTPAEPQKLCTHCHLPVETLSKNIPVRTNVLTGYSRTTKKMWECESCHAHPGHFFNVGKGRTAANNACFTCHK